MGERISREPRGNGAGFWRSCSLRTRSAKDAEMLFMTGWTTDRRYLAEIKRLGWARMMSERMGTPFEGELFGVDNGAFGAWNNAETWDGQEFLGRVRTVSGLKVRPYLAVTPDKVADPDSLRFSLGWRDRLASYEWPWYLAVQDGMTCETVRPVLGRFSGLFLGGTKRWKRETAKQWAQLAHKHGIRCHYARCSVEADLRHARRCGYDSADSTFLLWTRQRFAEFAAWFGQEPDQGGLFGDE